MDDRVSIDKSPNQLMITIKAFKDEGKQKMLLVWIALFSICGVAIVSQFFGNYESTMKIFFGVYVAFWLFFEFKVIYAYRWRKYGIEQLLIESDKIILVKEIGKRGITQKYNLADVNNFRVFNNKDGDFVKSMTDSYWNINKYALAFNNKETIVPFAIDLSPKAAKYILKEIKNYQNERIVG